GRPRPVVSVLPRAAPGPQQGRRAVVRRPVRRSLGQHPVRAVSGTVGGAVRGAVCGALDRDVGRAHTDTEEGHADTRATDADTRATDAGAVCGGCLGCGGGPSPLALRGAASLRAARTPPRATPRP